MCAETGPLAAGLVAHGRLEPMGTNIVLEVLVARQEVSRLPGGDITAAGDPDHLELKVASALVRASAGAVARHAASRVESVVVVVAELRLYEALPLGHSAAGVVRLMSKGRSCPDAARVGRPVGWPSGPRSAML